MQIDGVIGLQVKRRNRTGRERAVRARRLHELEPAQVVVSSGRVYEGETDYLAQSEQRDRLFPGLGCIGQECPTLHNARLGVALSAQRNLTGRDQ